MIRKYYILIFIFSFLLLCCAAQADDLDAVILRLMQKRHIPGLSLAIIQDGKILKAKGYGYIDKDSKTPVTTNTLFQAGSISKSVAAAGALYLVEHGKLSLDEDVNVKLRTWKVPDNEFTKDKKVTVRGILSHTTGLTVHGFPGYEAGSAIPTVPQILDGTPPTNTAPVRVDFIPGTNWRYSGGGYTVMQQLMIDVTGQAFPPFMQQTVLKPLQMLESTYQQPLPADKAKLTATGHYNDRSLVKGRWHVYPEMAAAGLWTTASDLARFAISIQNSYAGKAGGVLSQKMTREMLTVQKNDDALGVFLQGEGKTLRFGHGGRDEGFDALLTASVERGQGIAIMINANDNSRFMTQVVDAIANHYHWDGFPTNKTEKHTAVTIEPEKLAVLEGRYELFNNRIITFEAKNNRLFTLEDGFEDEEFIPVSPTRFMSADRNVSLTFAPKEDGSVDGLAITDDGETRKIPRIGPLFHAPKTVTDPHPDRMPKIKVALEGMFKGREAVKTAPGITIGARRDFSGGMQGPDEIRSLTFVHSENVAGRGIQRHDSDVSEIITYQIDSDQHYKYILVHLTADGLVTDCDLVER